MERLHASWLALVALLTGAAGGAVHHLKEAAPSVIEARMSVQAPGRTPLESDGKPRPVVLTFSASVAPLARVGKEAPDVHLSPELPGRWTWTGVNRLEFTPAEDWPIDARYTVSIDAKALAPHIALDKRWIGFRTAPFTLEIRNASFYQDPIQHGLRKAVYEIGFSHPVDPETLEKRLSTDGGRRRLTATYDKHKLNATVHSEPLAIPTLAESLVLRIAAGVKAQRGGNATSREAVRALLLPSLFSLEIDALRQLIVTGENGEPETLLQITAGMPVHEKEMARAVSAWLLPIHHPKQGARGEAYAWSDPAEATEEVLKQSQRIALAAAAGERETMETHALKFKAEAGRYLLVRVERGLVSAGGFRLGATRDEIVQVKRFAPQLAIMSQGSLLALSGEKKLPILVRDLPGLRIEIGRLLPHQLQHLVSQTQGAITRPEFYAGITPDHLTERFEKKIVLSLPPGKPHYESVDFSSYLRKDNADRRGVFLLTVEGFDAKLPRQGAQPEPRQNEDPEHESEGELERQLDRMREGEGEDEGARRGENAAPASIRDRRLVIVTDLGIVAKQAVDGTRDVFVQSIASGRPVAGATVEVWARNGSVLASQASDASGRARLPTLNGLAREKAPVVLVVRKNGDLSFLPLNRGDRGLDTSRFDVGGLRSASAANQIRAYLFSDRGLYRPGDTINIGIVARATDWGHKLADLPVEAEVIDARGLLIRREKLKLGPGGMAELSHTTQDTSPTGNYTVHLNLARDSGSSTPGTPEIPPLRLGSVTVKVQEFLPDRMKLALRLSSEVAEGWVSPAELKAKLNVQNLFGTPAPKRRVDAQLTLEPAFPAFRSYREYSFFDPQRAQQGFSTELPPSETDENGDSEIALGLQRYARATYQAHVLVRAFEPEGGRSVGAETTALVSDRPYLVGYKADGDLAYVNRNAAMSLSLIAIDPAAKKTAVEGLRLVRLERKVLSVLVRQGNGLYKYESRAKETLLKEEPFAIAAAGATLALGTQTPGNFAYVVRDAEGLELARVEYSVAGTGNVSRSLERNAELQLALNKKDFAPGETIEISIRAPYAGAGLITIERDRVYAHQWFRARNSATVQKITVPKDFEGNGYVTVQFTRDPASAEIYMSPLSYGIAPFATTLAQRTSEIRLHAPELVKPGEPVAIRLESSTPTRAVVFAVDEGILQVARYQAPDPLKFFFQKRALEVGTQQTLDLILPEFRKLMAAAAPGGDAEAALGKHLNPFKRKRDKPVVYWSGIVEVSGSREFSYRVPESFNGTLRIMAVAVDDATLGAAGEKTTVRGDLVLLPNVPLALTPGDEVEVGVGVANNAKGSGKDAPVVLSLEVSAGLEILGEARQTLKISERSEASTKFRIRARAGEKAELGSASVIFDAQFNDVTARLATDVSLRPASAYVTLVQTGLFRGTGEIATQTDFYPAYRRSELAVSASPWAFSAGLIQYLDVYPHLCTEQLTSRIFPAVVLATQRELAKELLQTSRRTKGADEALDAVAPDPAKALERYLAIVRSRQQADGGIALWAGGASEPFATAYVVNFMIEAREHKLAVPNDLLQRANVYLQTSLAQASHHDYTWRTQAYAAYLLTRQGIVTTAALTNLREVQRNAILNARDEHEKNRWRRDLGAVYLAASYQMLKQEGIGQDMLQPAFTRLLEDADKAPPRDWYWNYYYDPLVHSASLIQMVARHFPKQLKQLPLKVWERLATDVRDGYYHSLSASSVVLAVDAYATAAAQSAAGKIEATAIDRKGNKQPLALPPLALLAKAAVLGDTVKVKLANGGELPLFYSWAESGFERNPPKAAASQGLEIVREFLDAKDKVVTEAQIGDEITVRLRIRATERRARVPQVAVVDLLPGGLEPVLETPSDSGSSDQPLWRRRLGGGGSWAIEYADIREDRVVFYGDVPGEFSEVTYKVRATNAGVFVVPGAYGEAMYERRVFGRSAADRFEIRAAR